MFHHNVYISAAFRDLALETYPALRVNAQYCDLFAYLLFPFQTDKDTDMPVICKRTLAMINGELDPSPQSHFVGGRFIEMYQAATGHYFAYSPWYYQQGLARMVTDLNLDPILAQALHDEIRTQPQPDREVTLASGIRRTRQRDSNVRKADLDRATQRQATYAGARKAIAYLNALPPNIFRSAVQKHYEEAVAVALRAENPLCVYQNLVTLRGMRTQPQQFYGPSKDGNTCRIFGMHRGLLTLSKDVALIIGQNWITFDLRSSQLAIAAFRWNVPAVIAFLRSGTSIWDELSTYLNLDLSAKPRLKEALYSLLYGACRRTIYRALAGKTNTRAIRLEPHDTVLGERLLKHPLMAAMYQARERQLEQILRDGGARDCYGYFIPLQPEDGTDGKTNERSILAQLAQAVEFKILEPVFDKAIGSQDFSITHWAHDGFSIHAHEQRRVKQVCSRIEEAVRASAAKEGVETYLERTHDPFTA